MKKSLLLLPLLAGLVLVGCDDKNNGENSGGGGGGGTPTGETVVLDFSADEFDIPHIDDLDTLYTFESDDMTYNDVGCFQTGYQGNNYLSLALKKLAGDGKVEEGENLPFFGNKESFGKAIKSIDVEISAQTGAADFYVAFADSAVTSIQAGQTSGTKKTAKSSTAESFTVQNTGSSEYFTICAAKDVGAYRKNGGIAKVTIHF